MSSKLSPIESMAVDAQNENGSQRSMGAILNDLPRTTQHIRMFWLICAALFVDFFDLTMGGAIAASLLNDGWTTLALNSAFFSAAGLGAAVGVFLAGILADRMGRIRVLQICLALMAFGTFLCAMAPNMHYLIAARVLAAVGMGGVPTIGYVYLSEVLPSRVRGSWISGVGIAVALSSTAASIVAYYMLPSGEWGWRLMFTLPALAGLFIIAGLRFIPESPRWLAAQGEWKRAGEEFAKISSESVAELSAPLQDSAPPAPASESRPHAGWYDLFRPPLLERLILAAGLAIAATVVSNSAVAWMPTVLLAGASIERGLGDNFVIMLGAPLGSLIGFFLLSRVSRKGALLASSLFGTVVAVACAYVERDTGLIPLSFVLMALINLVCTIILGIYLPELFPTSLRGRGTSLALTTSRLSLIAAPFAMAAVLETYGRMGVMLGLMACLLAVFLLVIWRGVETASGPLED